MDAFVYPLAALLLVVTIILAAAVRSRSFFKLALSFFLKKRRLTMLTILGLVVGSAMTTGSLAVGDSIKQGVIEEVYANLGGVDEAIRSNGLFNESIASSLSGNGSLAMLTDAIAPLIILKGSARDSATGAFKSNVNIIGYDSSFSDFGRFTSLNGSEYIGPPDRDEAIVNRMMAENVLHPSSVIEISTRNPEFSIESIFSPLSKQISFTVTVQSVVRDVGLGRFNLESGRGVAENVFMDLGFLQEKIQGIGKINAVIISNAGDDAEALKLTSQVMDRLQMALDAAVGHEDVNMHLDVFSYLRVESENVFFDEHYSVLLESMVGEVPGAENTSTLTSYFVDNITFGSERVPFSTVTGLDPMKDFAFGPFIDEATKAPIVGDIEDDEMILTDYTANRLGAGVGDRVNLSYTFYSGTFMQMHHTASFTVRHVVNLTGKANDPNLMPPFPGIRGKASCGDWDPTWTSRQQMTDNMTDEDLDYWVAYGGTPKAYITLGKAQELWSNDLGNVTTVKVNGASLPQLAYDVGARLDSLIDHGDAGLSIFAVKQDGIESAEGVQLLTETFISFGAVVIISGIVLAVALVSMMMEGRRKEIGVLKTIGMRRRQVTLTFAFEAFFISIFASMIGVLLGIVVALTCIALTTVFWSNIVEGTVIPLYFSPETLVIGLVAGFLISFLTFVISAHWISGSLLSDALREPELARSPRRRSWAPSAISIAGLLMMAYATLASYGQETPAMIGMAGAVVFLISMSIIAIGNRRRETIIRLLAAMAVLYVMIMGIGVASKSESVPFLVYFASGFAIIALMIIGLASSLRQMASVILGMAGAIGVRLGTLKVSFLSPARRVKKTVLTVSLFAIVIFTYLGLSANIEGQQLYLEDMVKHQGAGFDVYAESSISLRFDLGDPSERVKNNVLNFPHNTTVVQFITYGQLGGSCSNLKKNLPPRLIGANASFVQQSLLRFQAPSDDPEAAWAGLDEPQSDGSIPVIGDTNTIVWILGKNIGERIQIVDERGRDRQLIVVGITENSIFPGSVFVSEDNLDDLYPTGAEYRLFLFRTDDRQTLVSYLEWNLQTYGLDASLVDDLVRSNLSIEWSYMGLFQALLLLGLVVGIFGLAASSFRAVEERKAEIGTMRALGFDKPMILKSVLLESVYVASLGVIVGTIAGLLTSFAFFGRGTLAGYSVAIPWLAIILIIVVVGVTAMLASILPAMRAARMNPVEALRKEQ